MKISMYSAPGKILLHQISEVFEKINSLISIVRKCHDYGGKIHLFKNCQLVRKQKMGNFLNRGFHPSSICISPFELVINDYYLRERSELAKLIDDSKLFRLENPKHSENIPERVLWGDSTGCHSFATTQAFVIQKA